MECITCGHILDKIVDELTFMGVHQGYLCPICNTWN